LKYTFFIKKFSRQQCLIYVNAGSYSSDIVTVLNNWQV